MHPKLLLQACSDLVRAVVQFDHPADAVVSKFFRDHRKTYALGQRERSLLAETVYNVLRFKLRYDHFAPSGSGPKERRLAILGFAQYLLDQSPTGAPKMSLRPSEVPKKSPSKDAQRYKANEAAQKNRHSPKDEGPIEFLKAALTEPEIRWIEDCLKIDTADLLDRHRHNLPEWLVEPLKAQLGSEFWDLVDAMNASAPLDLRVNSFVAKREDVQAQLKADGIKAVPTPFSPWGLRIAGKPSLSDLARLPHLIQKMLNLIQTHLFGNCVFNNLQMSCLNNNLTPGSSLLKQTLLSMEAKLSFGSPIDLN